MLTCQLNLGNSKDTVAHVRERNTMFDINIAFSKKWIFFQCMHKVPVSQLTVHIIAHQQKLKNHLAVYDHLESWVLAHLYWIQHVSREMLTKTGLEVEEFASKIILPKVPIDELGLLVIARMYHAHFEVVLKDRVWYTTDDNTAACSKFLLMYQGKVCLFWTHVVGTGICHHHLLCSWCLDICRTTEILKLTKNRMKSQIWIMIRKQAVKMIKKRTVMVIRNQTVQMAKKRILKQIRKQTLQTIEKRIPIMMSNPNLKRMTKWIYLVNRIQRQKGYSEILHKNKTDYIEQKVDSVASSGDLKNKMQKRKQAVQTL